MKQSLVVSANTEALRGSTAEVTRERERKSTAAVARGRLGGLTRAARYSQDEVRVMTQPARDAARKRIEEWAVAEFNLDPAAPDYLVRLDRGVSIYYSRIRSGQRVTR